MARWSQRARLDRWYQRYNRDEDEVIKRHMMDINKNVHKDVLKRCRYISENFLPDRSPEGIRERWYSLIGKKLHMPQWEDDLKDVADLLTPEIRQRLRVRVRMPSVTRTRRRAVK